MITWRVHYSNATGAGYSRNVRAWTRWGAKRKARFYQHQGWKLSIRRIRG